MGKKEVASNNSGVVVVDTRGEFKLGDRIFAKLKGYPYWPAKIVEIEPHSSASKIKYQVKFYGTYETTFLKADSLLHFNEENLKKHGESRKLKTFNHGMWEIQHDPELKLIEGEEDDEETEETGHVQEEEDQVEEIEEKKDSDDEDDQESKLVDIEKQSSTSESSKRRHPPHDDADEVKVKKKSKKQSSVEKSDKKKSSKRDKKSPKKKKQKKERHSSPSSHKHKKSKKKKRSSDATAAVAEEPSELIDDTNMSAETANSVINSASATSTSSTSSSSTSSSDQQTKSSKRHKRDDDDEYRGKSPDKKRKRDEKKEAKKRGISESSVAVEPDEPRNKVRKTEERSSKKTKRVDKEVKSPHKIKTEQIVVENKKPSNKPDIKTILQSISKESRAQRLQVLKETWPSLTEAEKEAEIKQMKEIKVLEKKVAKLKSIRVQFALVRMDMEIKKSLKLDNTDVNRCCMILEDLLKLPITPKQLFNVPEIVETIKKCRKFQACERVKKMASECFTKFTQQYSTMSTASGGGGETFSTVFERERSKYMSEHEDELKRERDLAAKMLLVATKSNNKKHV